MKGKLLGTLVILFLSQIAQAHATARPEKCPEVKAIQSAGITSLEQRHSEWFGSVESAFETEYQWTFMLGPVVAESAAQARDKLIATLATLTLLNGPTPYAHISICQYNTEQGVEAAAVNPPMPPLPEKR
ncbi:MAG: hypothetical protein ACYCQI_12940 [Gammaproteobacteria bacterium]